MGEIIQFVKARTPTAPEFPLCFAANERLGQDRDGALELGLSSVLATASVLLQKGQTLKGETLLQRCSSAGYPHWVELPHELAEIVLGNDDSQAIDGSLIEG